MQFYKLYSNSKNELEQFIIELRKTIEEYHWVLPEAIKNSYSHLNMIEQKIDQAKNREMSFKYEI